MIFFLTPNKGFQKHMLRHCFNISLCQCQCFIYIVFDNLIGIIEPVSWVAMMMICMSSCLGIQILDAEHNIDNMINGHQNRDTEPHIASP